MKEKVKDMVMRVRVALDEITGVDVDSDFVGDMNLEIEQALLTAATELSEELPDHLLMPITESEIQVVDNVETVVPFQAHDANMQNGTGALRLPSNFLRLVKLRLRSWPQEVVRLTDPSSNEARMQASNWTWGTPQKPVVILGESWTDGNTTYRVLKYYTAGKNNNAYDHTVWRFSYLAMPEIVTDNEDTPPTKYLDAGLHDRAIPLVVNRACAIILEAKQNTALAERFRAMSAVS